MEHKLPREFVEPLLLKDLQKLPGCGPGQLALNLVAGKFAGLDEPTDPFQLQAVCDTVNNRKICWLSGGELSLSLDSRGNNCRENCSESCSTQEQYLFNAEESRESLAAKL